MVTCDMYNVENEIFSSMQICKNIYRILFKMFASYSPPVKPEVIFKLFLIENLSCYLYTKFQISSLKTIECVYFMTKNNFNIALEKKNQARH